MEVLIFIALIVIFIIALNIQGSQRSSTETLKKHISNLNNQIQELREHLEKNTTAAPAKRPEELQQQKEASDLKAQEEYRQKIAAIEAMRLQREEERRKKQETELSNVAAAKAAFEEQYFEKAAEPAMPAAPKESRAEKWMKNNPDLEKFIGENLFNKIGIAVLVFGIGFFVKYAIDKDWIGEYGRVAIGLFCGIVLIGLAHYLRKSYKSFSSVLTGGGIAVFYFTIAIAFHLYGIIGQTPAFFMMIVITAFAVMLSVLYDKQELAVISAIGGFLTPFLVSTGAGNYIVLFSYLIILNIGLLALSYFKRWPLINVLSLFFTVIIYSGWMLQTFFFKSEIPPYANALLFAAAFYVIFLGMNLVHNISRQKAFKAFDFFILLLINFSFYAAGMIILTQWHDGAYRGLFTIAMGTVNLLAAIYFFKTQKADRNLLYLLIGLTLTFLSLTAPVQLHGHSITLFWCAETVLLYWLSLRSGIKLFKTASVIVCALMIISLLMDWQVAGETGNYHLPVIFTGLKGIVTNITAVAAFVAYFFLLRKAKEDNPYIKGVSNNTAANVFLCAAGALVYLTCFFGINLHFGNEEVYTLPNVYHRILTNLFALLIILFVLPKIKGTKLNRVPVILLTICFLYYIFSGNLITSLVNTVHTGLYGQLHLMMHWLSDVLLLIVFYKAVQAVRKNIELLKPVIGFLGWLLSFMVIYILSFELTQLYSTLFAGSDISDTQQQFTKAGLTILWALCSFAMIWLGMKHRYKPLRIISITLFGIALIKLFAFDITNIGPGGKIAAFILLGVLLLIISFMYQRLKKLLIDDKNL